MNNVVFFTLILLAIGLCTLHFCCGYYLGESRRKRKRRAMPATGVEMDRLAYQAAVNTLIEEALRVSSLPSDARPDALKVAMGKLGSIANRVERAASSFDFSPSEVKSLTTKPDGTPLTADGNVCNERRPYPTWQYMTSFTDTLPDPADFKDVYCHDLSVGGISYLSPDVPKDMQICISVGTAPDWLLMEAQVANYRSIQYKGLPMFLIGCRFSRRIGSFSELWPNKVPKFGQPISIHPLPSVAQSSECNSAQSA
jgi:hypothetical protein